MEADPYSLPNVTTADGYTDTATLTGSGEPGRFFVEITGAVVAHQLQQKNGGWGPERTRGPWVGLLGDEGYGIRFRSATPGFPAQVAGQFYPHGTALDSGAAPTYTVNAQGRVSTATSVIVAQVILQADVTVAATLEADATTILSSGAITADGATTYRIEAFLPKFIAAAALVPTLVIKRGPGVDGPVSIGLAKPNPFPGVESHAAMVVAYDTPPAGSWSYLLTAYVSTSSFTVNSGNGAGGTGEPLPTILTVSTA